MAWYVGWMYAEWNLFLNFRWIELFLTLMRCSKVGSSFLGLGRIYLAIFNFRLVFRWIWVIFDMNEVFRWSFLKFGKNSRNSGFLSTSIRFFRVYRQPQNLQNYWYQNKNTKCKYDATLSSSTYKTTDIARIWHLWRRFHQRKFYFSIFFCVLSYCRGQLLAISVVL